MSIRKNIRNLDSFSEWAPYLPVAWSPMKNELDDLFGTIGSSVDRAWRDLSPGEDGG